MSVSKGLPQASLSGIAGGFAPLDSGLLVPSAYYQHGSAFPGSPATNQRFYRDDLGMEFYYDGTRWLSVTLYQASPTKVTDNIAVTFEVTRWAVRPPLGTDIWLISFSNTYLVSGGTALGASHKWVITLLKYDGAAAVTGTHSIASGASSVWRGDAATTIGELLGAYYLITATATKTGTPGNLYYYGILNYRIVAT